MLNLAYELENTIEIDGEYYDIDMSYDNVLRLYDLFNETDIDDAAQIEIAFQMLLNVEIDISIEVKSDIVTKIFENLISDKKSADNVDIKGNPMPESASSNDKVMSFKQDADYIYASFMQDYNIDLFEQQGKLDWRKFLALLDGLKKDTRLKEVIEIRTMEMPTGKGSSKQRDKIKKAKDAYKLYEE
ncbi:hypothetical protein AZF04_09770 [Alkalihalobacillus trypoxylicola]|uniref:Bacteriophage Gp15 protein n=1 Tax=Alkalihalobacillus trypoxylicola TaxID=519424 RepID=A0A161QGT4_9BACI|nr:hypothetical protein AZF04_09770 [Alkalihalobacillus trypoxylicola]